MKQQALFIGGYAVLVFIGGIIGYMVAHSLPSLIASSIFSLILLTCSGLVMKGNAIAYHIATFATTFLLAFFAYRFFLTNKIAPGGIMTLVSGALLVYLICQRKKVTLSNS